MYNLYIKVSPICIFAGCSKEKERFHQLINEGGGGWELTSVDIFGSILVLTAPATGNVKMKRVCFRTKRVCFSSANVGVVFSLSLETRRKSLLVPCSVYSWIIHGIL